MSRMGRHGRTLGRETPVADLEEEYKRRLLEESGIDDDLDDAERNDLLRVIVASNPDLLKKLKRDLNGATSNAVIINQEPTVSENLMIQSTLAEEESVNQYDVDATQPPDPVVIDSDEDKESEGGKSVHGMDDSSVSQGISSSGDTKDKGRNSGLASPSPSSPKHIILNEEEGTSHPSLVKGTDTDDVEEDEMQAYFGQEQLAPETQWLNESTGGKEAEVIIPESDSSEGEDNVCSLRESKFKQKDCEVLSSHEYCNMNVLGKTWSPLFPNKDIKRSFFIPDQDKYSHVVAFMLELYLRRSAREKSRLLRDGKLHQAPDPEVSGKPVQTGPHVEGCLRAKKEVEGLSLRRRRQKLDEVQEVDGRDDVCTLGTKTECQVKTSGRVLRTGENQDFEADEVRANEAIDRTDPYNLDNDEDDFESTRPTRRGFNSADQPTTDGNFIRKSARVCAMRLEQQTVEDSDLQVSECSDGDEWHPESKKTTNKAYRGKGVQKSGRVNSFHLQKIGNGLGKRKGKRRLQQKEESDEPDRAKSHKILESKIESDDHLKLSLVPSNDQNGLADDHKFPEQGPPNNVAECDRQLYKFNSSEEDCSDQAESSSTSPINQIDERPEIKDPCLDRKHEEVLIASSDSDQSCSNDALASSNRNLNIPLVKCATGLHLAGDKGEKLSSAPVFSHVGEICSQKKAPSLLQDQDANVDVNKERLGDLSVAPKFGPIEKLHVYDEGKDKLSQDSTLDIASCSQSSNSLIDDHGNMYCTQLANRSGRFKGADTFNSSTSGSNLRKVPPQVSGQLPVYDVERHQDKGVCSLSPSVDTRKKIHRKRKVKDDCSGDSNWNTSLDKKDVEEITLLRAAQSNSDKPIPTDSEKSHENEEEIETETSSPAKKRRLDDRNLSSEMGATSTPTEDVTASPNPSHNQSIFATDLQECTEEVEQVMTSCPICSKRFPLIDIEAHASSCGEVHDVEPELYSDCMYCKESVAQSALKQHQGICAEAAGRMSESSSFTSARVTRSRRGDQ